MLCPIDYRIQIDVEYLVENMIPISVVLLYCHIFFVVFRSLPPSNRLSFQLHHLKLILPNWHHSPIKRVHLFISNYFRLDKVIFYVLPI